MENFCVACSIKHDSPKWYNSKDKSGLICKKAYLKQYHSERKEAIAEKRRERYHKDENYRKEINDKNKENDKRRRASGYIRKRKPRNEWTEKEKQKAKEAKQKYKEKHPDRFIQQNKEYHAKHYKNNIELYAKINKAARETPEYQYSYLKANANRRKNVVKLTYEQYIKKRQYPCHYCNQKLRKTSTWLDILNPKSKIYDEDGTVPCCPICNYLKGVYLTEEETLFTVLALKKFHLDRQIPEKINFGLCTPKSKPLNERYELFILNAMARGIKVFLTKKDYIALLQQPCFYCGGKATGLDRMDNKDDYHFHNCVPCCGVCNRIKADLFDYEDAFVMINAVQKIRIFNQKSIEKVCAICGTKESSRWAKHPEEDKHLCLEHYPNLFSDLNNKYNAQVDIDAIYAKYYINLKNRVRSKRDKFIPECSKKIYEEYMQIIESKKMTLLTTFEEYKKKVRHKKLTIKCSNGHVFKRVCERIKTNSTCPDCEGTSNRGGAFKEKLEKKGWAYISGEYVNKKSILTAVCRHGKEETKPYFWLRLNNCSC